MRFHTQTGGVTLQAQQPLNNVVRVTVQALAATLGGTQSLHTNGYDEALALPTAEAATLALRTQQIVGYESGVAQTVDPLAGSWYVEQLTDEIERRALELLTRVDELGGAAEAIRAGFFQEEIGRSAYEYQLRVEAGETVVVGVNRFGDGQDPPIIPLPISRPSSATRSRGWRRWCAARSERRGNGTAASRRSGAAIRQRPQRSARGVDAAHHRW